MNKLVLLSLLLLLGGLAMYAHPQRAIAELEMDGVMLHLGMTKAEVSAKLAGKQYWKVNDDNWVSGPSNGAGPLMQFTEGRLNYTERYRATPSNDATEALFGAVRSLNQGGFHNCNVTAGVKTSPNSTEDDVRIACGEKSVVVIRLTVYGKTYTMVHEELGRQHFEK